MGEKKNGNRACWQFGVGGAWVGLGCFPRLSGASKARLELLPKHLGALGGASGPMGEKRKCSICGAKCKFAVSARLVSQMAF